jgi:hypothetical protein
VKISIWKFVWSVMLLMIFVICATGTSLPAARADEKAEAIGHNNDGVKLLQSNDYKGALEEFTITRIPTNSELKDLWDESDSSELWYQSIDDLMNRIDRNQP